MKSKRFKLVMIVITMGIIGFYGCGNVDDNANADNPAQLESNSSEQLVKDNSETEAEVDSVDESTETDVEAQADDAESADKEEEENVSLSRDLETVELIEVDGEYAVTKNDKGVVFRVKCKDLERKKVGESYLLEYAPSEAEEIEENVYVIEGEDLIPDKLYRKYK